MPSHLMLHAGRHGHRIVRQCDGAEIEVRFADDLIVMNRPSKYGKSEYQPLSEPVPVDLGEFV